MPTYAVTGASRGIGFAIEFVRQLSAQNGNIVFAIVRSPSTAENLKKFSESQKNVHILKADLDDAKSWKVAAKEVAKTTGGSLDVFINNAANTSSFDSNMLTKGLEEYPSEDELTAKLLIQFKHNTIGAIHATNAFIPLVKRGSVKKVVNISSGSANLELILQAGIHTIAPYAISKAALNMAVAKYAAEYKDTGLAFLALDPGMVNTATAPPDEETMKAFGAMIEGVLKVEPDWNGQPLTPEESVKMCLDVIDKKFTIKDTGAFWSHYGNNTKWM